QGTDGIRRETRQSNITECKDLTPQQVFLEKGWINEQFMELYSYSHIKNLYAASIKYYSIIISFLVYPIKG
ncbi:MAG: hypothetical protein VX429_06770, partial [Nitrospinota bacterium]|nr:hypothetical protein [Nitrospinota bacterium]